MSKNTEIQCFLMYSGNDEVFGSVQGWRVRIKKESRENIGLDYEGP